MPVSKLLFRPGINREGTTYVNEGGYFDCDKVRFRAGLPEKIGGWVNQAPNYTYKGAARSLWNWTTLAGVNLLAVGTNQKYYVEEGGEYHDITPLRTTATLGAAPFATTNGSPLVTVTHTAHGASTGSFVTFSGASAVAGLTLSGEYEIISAPTADTYTVLAGANANATTTGGGASVSAAYQINVGNAVYTYGSGWGVPPWGAGGFGSSTSVRVELRLWSEDNFGEDLLFAQRGGEIYYWDVDTSTYARAVTLTAAANAVTKLSTTATSAGIGSTITVADADGITAGMVVAGTNVVAGSYVTTAYVPGSTTVPLSVATTGAASGTYTFSYAGRFTPTQTLQVLVSDTSRIVIALGANSYDPTTFTSTYDPMLVRWSDQDDPYEWIPAADNQAGEQRLVRGSSIICGYPTRQEILVWTDSALYSMQYIGGSIVYGFQLLADNISVASPNAVAGARDETYWMGLDKFYTYTGRVDTLPCSLRREVFSDINRDQMSLIVAGTNEGFNEVWWFYPSDGSLVNDRYVVYNYLEKVWYHGSLMRTVWLDSPLRSYPMAAFSVQNTYLSAAIGSADTTIPCLNTNSYPSSGSLIIDSEEITYTGIAGSAFTGCTRGTNNTAAASHAQYAAVTYAVPNQVCYHEYGVDDGMRTTLAAIEAYVESSDFDIGDGHNMGFVWRILPDITFTGSTANSPAVTLTVKPRRNSGSAYGTADEPTVTRTATYPVEQYTGQVMTRIRGRQMSFRISSDALGVAWQLGAPRIDIRPDGRR